MIAAAATLCGELDFVRVDFFDTPEKLYFGELTTSPECAMGRFLLEGLDRRLGRHWNLPRFTTLRPALRSAHVSQNGSRLR
jgi:hypothetical protein